jgi:putative addiction module CopG family antidote
MTVHVPEDLERFVKQQVQLGAYPSEEEVVRVALEQLRARVPARTPGPGSIGAMRDDAELLDQVIEEAMKIREERPWRLAADE